MPSAQIVDINKSGSAVMGVPFVIGKAQFLLADRVEDRLRMSLAAEDCFPRRDLRGFVKIAVGDLREVRGKHLGEEDLPACDFPSIQFPAQLLSAVPEAERLLFVLSSPHRMGRDRESSLRPDRSSESDRVALSREVFGDADPQHVGGTAIGNVVLSQLETRENHHAILFPGSLCLGLEDFEVERESGPIEGPAEIACGSSDQSVLFAEMVRDRDRPEAPAAIEIHQLGDRELPVAESRVHVEIGQHHVSQDKERLSRTDAGCVRLALALDLKIF